MEKKSHADKRALSLWKLKSEMSPVQEYRDFKRKPIFSTLLTNRSAVQGSNVRLTATAIGVDCKVVWLKNNRVIENGGKYRTNFNSDSGLAILELNDVDMEDSGEYTCVVGNSFGENETSAQLKVYGGFEQSPFPPTFTRTIRGTFHYDGSSFFISF